MTSDITFTSRGSTCAGWHVPATDDSLASGSGRPCVVMAHGFGGTRDSGLMPYAEGLAAAGIDAFVFDYRGFGASEGHPRQDVNVTRQRQDFHSAIDAARRLPGVDPDRIALWGTSYAAGHVVAVAAQRRVRNDIVGIVALNPAVDGIAAVTNIARRAGIGQLAWLSYQGVKDVFSAMRGQPACVIPIVGMPGSRAMMTTEGAAEVFEAMAGPTAVNEVCARHALKAALNRPIVYAGKVSCPMLVQIGTNDQVAPATVAHRMARKTDLATIRSYPLDHFDVYIEPWSAKLCADQVEFLTTLMAH